MKRWTAILLALAVLLTLLPASALAAVGESTDSFCSMTSSGKHSWGDWKTTQKATCTRKGARERTCGRCGYTQTQSIKKAGHKWGDWRTTVEASCTKQGRQTRKCSVCGETETRQVDKKAHSWGAWTVIREPSDFSMGLRSHVCQTCGAERTADFYPEGTLQRGDSGDGVRGLQEKLNAAGFDCGAADGIFGGKTEAAVRALEAANGFTTDGIAWPGVQKWLTPGTQATAYSNGQSAAGILAKLRAGSAADAEQAPALRLVQYTHGAVMSDATLKKLGYPGCYLTVKVSGGKMPYRYTWYRGGNSLEKFDRSRIYVTIPGKYFCLVTDAAGRTVRTGWIPVKYTGTDPRFVKQPGTCTVPWRATAATLTCRAVSGTGGDNGLVYRWQKKRGNSWVYLGQTGRTLRLEGIGIGGVYRCVVRDKKTGGKSVSRAGYVKAGLAIRNVRQMQAGANRVRLLFTAVGGCAPYRVTIQMKAYTSGYDPIKRVWTGSYALKTVWQGAFRSSNGAFICNVRVPRKYIAMVDGKRVETNAVYVITVSSPDIGRGIRRQYTIRGK